MSNVVIFCPACRTEYREGIASCSDCGVTLVRRLEQETGQQLVPLARETSAEFVAELLDRLEQHAVPYVIQAGTALHLLEGEASQLARPNEWEARIWVSSDTEADAVRIREELAAEWRVERGTEVVHRYLSFTNPGRF